MEGEGGGADPLILLRRAEIKDAYARLLEEHPALPQEIRDFQVQLETWSLALNCSQADVTAAALSQDSHHILSSVPTGWGKTPQYSNLCLFQQHWGLRETMSAPSTSLLTGRMSTSRSGTSRRYPQGGYFSKYFVLENLFQSAIS